MVVTHIITRISMCVSTVYSVLNPSSVKKNHRHIFSPAQEGFMYKVNSFQWRLSEMSHNCNVFIHVAIVALHAIRSELANHWMTKHQMFHTRLLNIIVKFQTYGGSNKIRKNWLIIHIIMWFNNKGWALIGNPILLF